MKNGNNWIDFNLIRQSVSMEMLIIYFALFPIQRKGDDLRLTCPFHCGKSDNSMAINLAKNSCYCFGCKAKGDVLDFVARFEDCSLHEAALLMDEWFFINRPKDKSREAADVVSKEFDAVPPVTPLHLI